MNSTKLTPKKIDVGKYWDEIYQKKDEKSLGWYQEIAQPSLDLFKKFHVRKEDKILIVGSGSTKFVDNLLVLGYKNIIATDISKIALMNLENRLLSHKHQNLSSRITFIEDDLRKPKELIHLENVDVWHDRAVFQFFTDDDERKAYLKLLKSVIKKNGLVLIAVYNKHAPNTSSGLEIKNYDADEIANFLGSDFELLKTFDYDFKKPTGEIRPFVYTFFERISE